MKYMGSKRIMLQNGLGVLIDEQVADAGRFVDLFSGTGLVARHVAERHSVPVLANDLQDFCSVLTSAVISRTRPLPSNGAFDEWILRAKKSFSRQARTRAGNKVLNGRLTASTVRSARRLCENTPGGTIWTAYGGHYYSPLQANAFDALLMQLPRGEPHSTVCRAALVLAASRCAAGPGHTAQPFQPTASSMPYVNASWSRCVFTTCEAAYRELAPRFALKKGQTTVRDANELAASLGSDDVAFVDPPYSAVHYSRFYHVLETVARGHCGSVEGVGRYPPRSERPASRYSIKSEALKSFRELLEQLGTNRTRTIVTFPQAPTSNGVGGEQLVDLAREWFAVDAKVLASRFSTLGGNNGNRSSRRFSSELIILLTPR